MKNPVDIEENYEIKMIFPFTSETKRMGIIVKHSDSGRYVFYLKGAENVLMPKLKPVYRSTVDESCEALAMEGLRTLVITQKIIDESYFVQWHERYREANSDLNNRQDKVNRIIEELEVDMELLGVTGVEDKLQDNVN